MINITERHLTAIKDRFESSIANELPFVIEANEKEAKIASAISKEYAKGLVEYLVDNWSYNGYRNGKHCFDSLELNSNHEPEYMVDGTDALIACYDQYLKTLKVNES